MKNIYAGQFQGGAVVAGSIRQINTVDGQFTHPAMSPDGTKVAYWGIVNGACDLWLTAIADGVQHKLSDFGGASFHPAWSPDSKQLVYCHIPQKRLPTNWTPSELYGSPPAQRDLWIINTDSGERRQITYTPEDDERPAWSPDGQTIAFVRTEGTTKNIWLLNLQSGTSTRLTNSEMEDYRPAWHPQGHLLALNNKCKGNHYLWQVHTDGSGYARVTPLADPQPMVADHGAAWSADGKEIRFHSNRSGQWGIWSITMDSLKMTKIDIPEFDSTSHATWSADDAWMSFDGP